MSEDEPTVGRLSVAPVKGTALVHPSSVEFDAYGARGDRRFHLVDPGGAHVSARHAGALLLVRSAVDPTSDELRLSFPDRSYVEGEVELGATFATTMFGRGFDSMEVAGPFSEALSGYLGRPVRLVSSVEPGDAQDGAQVSIVSRASLDQVSRWQGHPRDPDPRRFRMTIELEGCAAFEEDTWEGQEVEAGTCVLHVESQVPRCLVIDLDPETGTKDGGLLRALARRRIRMPDNGLPLGVYARVVRPGRISVGDAVRPPSVRRSGSTGKVPPPEDGRQ